MAKQSLYRAYTGASSNLGFPCFKCLEKSSEIAEVGVGLNANPGAACNPEKTIVLLGAEMGRVGTYICLDDRPYMFLLFDVQL